MPPIDFDILASSAFDQIKCVLGIEVLYLPKAGGAIVLRGIFDDRIQEVDPDTDKIISSNIYTFGCKIDDIGFKPVKGDKIVINNVFYQVIESREDGVPDVSTVLILHKVVAT